MPKQSKSSGIIKRKRNPVVVLTTMDLVPSEYGRFLEDIKSRIQAARVKATLAVNRELVLLYWDIGRSIVTRQKIEGWGTAIVDRLAEDIQKAFPGIVGFSHSNIWRMRSFYLAWTETKLAPPVRVSHGRPNLAPPVRDIGKHRIPVQLTEIPWSHNIILFEKIRNPRDRLWYAQKTIENGWSRSVLIHQIECRLHERQGKAVSNFDRILPPPQSDMAQQTLKDPYIIDFLSLAEDAAERELERGLVEHIRKFLLELGIGFAFVGSQYHLEVDGDDFYLDLLFYHLRLRCFVVIDLKMESFKPEFAGKMNFYLSAVDALIRHREDNPSSGIILCKTKKKLIAEYALRNTTTPIGISEYKLTRSIPSKFKTSLPTIQELEKELGK
jgi:predicted nuclease of restriction endonuclease-like (RecB) superfamily